MNKKCEWCKKKLKPKNPKRPEKHQRFCDAKCRMAQWNKMNPRVTAEEAASLP